MFPFLVCLTLTIHSPLVVCTKFAMYGSQQKSFLLTVSATVNYLTGRKECEREIGEIPPSPFKLFFSHVCSRFVRCSLVVLPLVSVVYIVFLIRL